MQRPPGPVDLEEPGAAPHELNQFRQIQALCQIRRTKALRELQQQQQRLRAAEQALSDSRQSLATFVAQAREQDAAALAALRACRAGARQVDEWKARLVQRRETRQRLDQVAADAQSQVRRDTAQRDQLQQVLRQASVRTEKFNEAIEVLEAHAAPS